MKRRGMRYEAATIGGALALLAVPAFADVDSHAVQLAQVAADQPVDRAQASPQDPQASGPSQGQPGPGMMGQGMGPGMMGQGPCPGMMGQGMGPGMMGQGMGPGMMGQGMGPGMMGQGMGPGMMRGNRPLSPENVRDILEGHLAWMGHDRLKVGEITESGDGAYVAEIVTVDDSLVERVEVDRASGRMQWADR